MAAMTLFTLLLLFITVVGITATTPICGGVCTCAPDFLKVDCSQTRLNVTPDVDGWPKNATLLDLSDNNISILDVEMTHDSLQTLILSHNKIKKINASVFGGLRMLKHLDLSSNQIQEFMQNTFYGLEGLVSLDISDNKLRTLPDDIFTGLLVMQELKLSGNEIVHFSRQHLNRMFTLKKVDISNIGAYSLPADLFSGFHDMEFLDLSRNEFPEVPTESIRSAKNLRELLFNENPIHELNKKSFLGMKNLQRLELNFNEELATVDSNTFSPLVNLRSLEMTHNKRLDFIHPDAFHGLFLNSTGPVLEAIDLQFNKLSTLRKIPCNKMKKMNLQRNPWACDCHFKWIRSCIIEEIYAADFKCMTPRELRNQLVVQTPEVDFKCEASRSQIAEEIHHNRVIRTISLALGCAALVVLAMLVVLVLKWRSIRWWWRNRRKGPGAVYYVRANPAQDL